MKKDGSYKLIDSDFIQNMNHSVTFNNSHHVIKKMVVMNIILIKLIHYPKIRLAHYLILIPKFRKIL